MVFPILYTCTGFHSLYRYPLFMLVSILYTSSLCLCWYPFFIQVPFVYAGIHSLYRFPLFMLISILYTGSLCLYWYPFFIQVPFVFTGFHSLYKYSSILWWNQYNSHTIDMIEDKHACKKKNDNLKRIVLVLENGIT